MICVSGHEKLVQHNLNTYTLTHTLTCELSIRKKSACLSSEAFGFSSISYLNMSVIYFFLLNSVISNDVQRDVDNPRVDTGQTLVSEVTLAVRLAFEQREVQMRR